MIAASITRNDLAATRPGRRFALIGHALGPLKGEEADPATVRQLKRDLAVVVSAEAFLGLSCLRTASGRGDCQRRLHRTHAHGSRPQTR
jgi:hypothetical protein